MMEDIQDQFRPLTKGSRVKRLRNPVQASALNKQSSIFCWGRGSEEYNSTTLMFAGFQATTGKAELA